MARGKPRRAAARESLLASKRFVAQLGARAKGALDASAAGLAGRAAGARGRSGGSGGSGGSGSSGVAGARGRAPLSDAARHRLREIGALALLGLTLILLLACLSSYGDSNLCGPTGELLAQWLLGSFGYAAYLLVVCLLLWGVTLFARLQPESFTVRSSGLVLCLVSFSAMLAHVFGNVGSSFPAGGVVGEYIDRQLTHVAGFGNTGALILLVVLTLITFVLATDVTYYAALSRGVGWMRARRQAAQQPGSPRPVAAGAGGKRRKAADGDGDDGDDPDDDLAPFAVLEDVPGASLPEPPAAADRARRAEDAASPRARARARVAGGEAGGETGGEAEAAAGKPTLRKAGGKSRATPEAVEPADAALLDADEAALDAALGAADSRAAGAGAGAAAAAAAAEAGAADGDASAGAAGAAAAAAAGKPRRAPVVRRPSDDTPLQLTLYGEPAESLPSDPGVYVFPTEDLLDEQTSVDQKELDGMLADKTTVLEKTLESFKIDARVVEIQKGPVISMFEMELGPGIKVERVRSLEDDLAIALRARSVRIVAPIPGKNTIGIEVPNPLRETVRLKPLLHCREFTENKFALPIFLGRDASGRPMIVDLTRMPHLLVAGATGSGKSVCLNSILVSFLYTRTPEQVKLILIDPKMVELTQFSNAPHLACPVVSDMKRAPAILEWAITKMDERYRLLNQAGVRNIYSYNKLGLEGLRPHFGERVDDPDFPRFMPFVVIVVDELADLMLVSAREVETSITRLAAKSRAVGIHLIVATQRPSTNVITGLIKANLPTRIGFMVSSKIDSRVILDENGAEQLLGEGDMLVMSPQQSSIVRGQGTFLSEDEVRRIMDRVKVASGPAYEPELVQRRSAEGRDPDEEDELYDAAVRFVFSTERGSASLLQRKFAIGYTRASRLIDMMAEEGVLGEYKGSQARELTMTLPDWIALKPDARGTEPGGEEPAASAEG